MIRLVKTPRKLETFLKRFKDLFTCPSHTSFSDMISAVSVCDKAKTISNLTDIIANDREGKKARASYNWFFTNAKWDDNEVAQRKATLFFESINLGKDDKLLLIIDDTYAEKEGDCIEGVGKFYDHSEDKQICLILWLPGYLAARSRALRWTYSLFGSVRASKSLLRSPTVRSTLTPPI